ncbi:superoxide dismutase [Rubeoparvulum massiliense]|uniref:superoxide dismutase n=1 Tax=Rubeoparvulum massiliense TaxID=1631346 RepID=UPI00065DF8E3|nr:superoxide dismutase [Rubeoparvulum massiliense]
MFTQLQLPYAFDALEPHLDARTMEIHYGKHHANYTNKLNEALEGHVDLQAKSIEEILSNLDAIPEAIRTTVRNNGGGYFAHNLYWSIMSPDGGGEPSGEVAQAIERDFGRLANLKEALTKAATGQFGSGWGWLVVNGDKLEVMSTSNQDTPLAQGKTPILVVDVWEHAYYLEYQNRRPDFVAAWWNVVNWAEVNRRYLAAIAK